MRCAGRCDRSIQVASVLLLSVAAPMAASAQTLRFGPTGAGGSGVWDNATANWFNGSTAVPWASGGTGLFGGTAGTVTVNGTIAVGGMIYSSSGYTTTGGTLALSGATPTITTNAGVSATINSLLTGASPLVKSGAGTLTIGNSANTYAGGTTVSQGTLVFGGNGALGTGTVTLGDANTGTSNVALLANFPNFSTGQSIQNNIVVSGSGSGTVSIGSTSFNPGSNGTIYSGTITLNRDITIVGGNADRTSFYGKITGTGNITITGNRVTLDSSANDFVGNVTITSGNVVQIDASNALPSTATLTILGNGQLRFANSSQLTIDGLNGSASAIISLVTGAAQKFTVGAANGSGAYAGVIGNAISSFAKLGSGTQVMSGANTYTGITRISGGLLSTQLLANGGVASGIGASSVLAANLVLDGGSLQYTGTGTSTNRQFTLTTNGGGLDASGSGALNFTSTAAITLNGAGPRTFALAGSSTAANTLNAVLGDNGGRSSLLKTGAGRWVLTANQNYTGETAIAEGTLALSGAASVASSSRVVADGTFDVSGVTPASSSVRSLAGNGSVALGAKTLVVTAANDTFSGNIAGSGGLTVAGGTQTLTGTNSYTGGTTITAGTLQLGNGGTSGSIVGDIVNGGTLIFNRSDLVTFDGTISGSGALRQIGSGLTRLAGNSSGFVGPTTVEAGRLAVNGSLAGSAVTVLGGATLGGNGTVGATTIQSGGFIAPGNSIGTLTVNGAFAQAAGSTYQVELDPGTVTSDRIAVNGTATLASGANLSVVNYTGSPYAVGQRYTILTSTGGLTGTYGYNQPVTAFFNLRDSYDANNAYLTVVQTATPSGVGSTPNEVEVGKSVESLPSGNAILDGLLNQASLANARGALNQLSGEIHASAKTALIDESWILRNAVNDRLRAAFGGVGAPSMVSMNYGYTADLARSVKGPMPALPADRFALWGQGFGSWGRTSSDGNASTMSRSTGGFLLGGDVAAFDNLRFGVLGGYSRSNFDVKARASSGESDNYHLGLYGGGQWGALSLRAGASYTWHDVSTSRLVTAAYLGGNPRADYDAATAQVFGEVGYRMGVGGIELEPFAGLAYVNLHTGRFAEAGAVTALSASSDDTGVGYSTLGLRASTRLAFGGTDLTLRGGLAWRYAFGDVKPSVTMAFAGSTPFTISGLPIARDAAVIEAGADMAIGRNTTLGLAYNGQLGQDTQDHSFKGVLAVKF